MGRPILATARLTLQPHNRVKDATRLFPILNDPVVMEHIGDGALTLDGIDEYLARHQNYWATTGMGGWTIERHADHAVLGNAFLKPMRELPEIEVGYCLGREYWGFGYGREVLSEIVRHAQHDRRLARVVAVVRPENRRSASLLLRCGFQLESIRKINGKDREFYVIDT